MKTKIKLIRLLKTREREIQEELWLISKLREIEEPKNK